jgi:hypothetical protein
MLPAEMESSTRIRVSELRTALELVLTQFEKAAGEELNLDADHYWDISLPEAFDVYSHPKPTIGQLTDDMERLRELTAGGANADVIVWHDLSHLIGILRWFSSLDLRSPRS